MQISSLELFACYEIMICYLHALSTQTYITEVITTRLSRVQPQLLTESVALSFKIEGYHLFDSHASSLALIFQKHFPVLGQVTCGYTTFTLLFVQHLPCWSRESTLVNAPAICSFLFLFTFLHFALLRATSHDNTQGLCQHGPESKLSPGENPAPDWQERALKHPCYYFPLNMRVSSVKASLETWPPGHSAKCKPAQLLPNSASIKHGKDTGIWKSLIICSFLLTVPPVLILWSPEYTR